MHIGKIYDDYIAERYDQDPFGIIESCRMSAFAQIKKNIKQEKLKILDLGVGTGELFLLLHQLIPHSEFLGIDVSNKMIEIAQQKFISRSNLKAKLYHADAHNLTNYVEKNSVDLAACHFLLAYVKHQEIIQKVYRALQKGGLFSIVTGTYECFPKLQAIVKNFFQESWIKEIHQVPESMETLKKILKGVGFDIVAAENFSRDVSFAHFDHLYNFARHASWFANPYFMDLTSEEISKYREMASPFFPIEDKVQMAILLAKKR